MEEFKKKTTKNMVLEQALKGSNVFLKRVTEAIKNESKRAKRRFFKYVIRYLGTGVFSRNNLPKKKRMGHT